MLKGKEFYLKKLTTQVRMRSVEVGREVEGTSPPSVFVGSWNYPKVYAGPMLTPAEGDTYIMDAPEEWIPEGKTQDDIISYRLGLVRGKKQIGVKDLGDKLVGKLQEVAMAKRSVESDAVFEKQPKGMSLSEEHTPYGPSAEIREFDVGQVRWQHDVEKAYYDTDLLSRDAVLELHEKDVPFSGIQKAFSVGCLGSGRKRRLVPTRWSITACDTILGNEMLRDVKHNDIIDCFQVREFSSLNNYYAVLLMPTFWQYEWMEAFIHILGREEMVFADHEESTGKKGYSPVGGCYYSCKMAVLEALRREGKQAGAIIFREAYPGYVPLGVYNVRENVRSAMKQKPMECADMRSALEYISSRLKLPMDRFHNESTLLQNLARSRQTTLGSFCN